MVVSEASAENEESVMVGHMMEMTFLIIPVQQQLELLGGSMQLMLVVCYIHSDMHF